MKPVEVKPETFIYLDVEINTKKPKSRVINQIDEKKYL